MGHLTRPILKVMVVLSWPKTHHWRLICKIINIAISNLALFKTEVLQILCGRKLVPVRVSYYDLMHIDTCVGYKFGTMWFLFFFSSYFRGLSKYFREVVACHSGGLSCSYFILCSILESKTLRLVIIFHFRTLCISDWARAN